MEYWLIFKSKLALEKCDQVNCQSQQDQSGWGVKPQTKVTKQIT